MHIVFQLYDVLRFDFTVVIKIYLSIYHPQNETNFFSMRKTTSTPEAELSCKL